MNLKFRTLFIIIIILFSMISINSVVADKDSISDNIQTIYTADISVKFTKDIIDGNLVISAYQHFHSKASVVTFDASLDEAVLEIVMNYSIEMNYNAGFPFIVLAPIVAFGIKVNNYTNYTWESVKLRHNGYEYCQGNISTKIHFNMEDYEPGDQIIFAATYIVITDPFLRDYEGHNGTDKFTSLLHRLIYNVPFLHKLFLESWFYTNLAPYNSHRGATIVINFD